MSEQSETNGKNKTNKLPLVSETAQSAPTPLLQQESLVIAANPEPSTLRQRTEPSSRGEDCRIPAQGSIEELKNDKDYNYKDVKLLALFSIIFPPLGWIGFGIGRDSPRTTPRGVWAYRGVAIGSSLAVLYTFVAAILVGQLQPMVDATATSYGCGFNGPCPLFV